MGNCQVGLVSFLSSLVEEEASLSVLPQRLISFCISFRLSLNPLNQVIISSLSVSSLSFITKNNLIGFVVCNNF